jgi:hypothetical protein
MSVLMVDDDTSPTPAEMLLLLVAVVVLLLLLLESCHISKSPITNSYRTNSTTGRTSSSFLPDVVYASVPDM